MKTATRISIAALAMTLGGCAGVQYKPIAVDPGFWQDRQALIAVAAEKMPEADAQMLGAQGLLDVAINRGNAARLIDQLKRLDVGRAAAIPNNLADGLDRRGFKIERLATIDVATFPEFKPDANAELYPPRDFRSLARRGIERLLLVSVEKIGTTRNYYGFIPTSAPRALFAVKGQLVDLKTNKLIWYDRQETTAAIPEPWDQDPEFPNVSTAVLRNLAEGAALLERSLFATPGAAPPSAASSTPASASVEQSSQPAPDRVQQDAPAASEAPQRKRRRGRTGF